MLRGVGGNGGVRGWLQRLFALPSVHLFVMLVLYIYVYIERDIYNTLHVQTRLASTPFRDPIGTLLCNARPVCMWFIKYVRN